VDSKTIAFRLSTSPSTEINLSAMVPAALVYSVALSASPALSASLAMMSACRAVALSLSSSSIFLFRRISDCFWLAMTFAACSLSRLCWLCASPMACSSCTFGSAFDSARPLIFATKYFHCLLMYLNMGAP
jgi:hypothetical protein